ncbi:MAG: beta-N-acetylhexosaminidase [Pseudobdellovibrionaceae bacterium]
MNKQIIGQHLLIGISGLVLTDDEKKFIVENNIGGVVLFSRNVSSPQQIHALCTEIQNLRHQMLDKAPLFIGIDMEGGRVARLKSPFTLWPPLKRLGDLDAPTASFNLANRMGLELKAVGINLDFAPCVDIFTNPQNTVIGDRSISTDAEMVGKHASALVRGYLKSEVVSCAKHFPGHGNTIVDSHEDLPIENLSMERLESTELIPFKRAFKARCPMTMTAHIHFPQIDPQWPVTLSEIFLKKILREDLRFKGLIITDDLDMKAMSKHYASELIPVQALRAGADLLLYCNEPASPPKAIEDILEAVIQGKLNEKDLYATHQKILASKKELLPNPDPMPLAESLKLIGAPDHMQLSQQIAAGEIPAEA